MQDNIGAILDRPQQDRRGNGVINDQRHAVLVRDLSQAFDIGHVSRRIAHTLAVDRAGIFVDQLLHIFGAIGSRKARRNSALREDVREQRVRGAVELRKRNDVVARLGNVNQRIFDRRHPGTHAESVDSSFKFRYTLL